MRKNVMYVLKINRWTEILRHNRALSNPEWLCKSDLVLSCSFLCIFFERELAVGNSQHPGDLELLGRNGTILAQTMDKLKCLT